MTASWTVLDLLLAPLHFNSLFNFGLNTIWMYSLLGKTRFFVHFDMQYQKGGKLPISLCFSNGVESMHTTGARKIMKYSTGSHLYSKFRLSPEYSQKMLQPFLRLLLVSHNWIFFQSYHSSTFSSLFLSWLFAWGITLQQKKKSSFVNNWAMQLMV